MVPKCKYEDKIKADTKTDTSNPQPSQPPSVPSMKYPPGADKRQTYPGITRITEPFSSKEPQPGDLVMSTAGEIHHPAVSGEAVDPSFILFGVVNSFTYVKWVTEDGQDKFDNYSNNHERVVVVWEPIDSLLTAQRFLDSNYWPCTIPRRNNTTYDVVVDIAPTHKHNLKILCKRNSCRLSGLNDFLCEHIVSMFAYDSNIGWQHKR